MQTRDDLTTDPVTRPGDADGPMKAHFVCAVCHPGGGSLGTVAVCGERILGIGYDGGPKCEACLRMLLDAFPCGH